MIIRHLEDFQHFIRTQLERRSREQEAATNVRGNKIPKLEKPVGSPLGTVFPVVSLVHDEQRKIALDAAKRGQAINVD